MKKCTKCGLYKDESQFHGDNSKKDGLYSSCKECKSVHSKEWYGGNLEANRKKGRESYRRNRTKRLVYSKRYYRKNRVRMNNINRERVLEQRKTEGGRKKYNAKRAVWWNLKKGNIKKQPCEVCGSEKVEAHHYLGYDKENQLKVRWLCRKHHAEEHLIDKQEAGAV